MSRLNIDSDLRVLNALYSKSFSARQDFGTLFKWEMRFYDIFYDGETIFFFFISLHCIVGMPFIWWNELMLSFKHQFFLFFFSQGKALSTDYHLQRTQDRLQWIQASYTIIDLNRNSGHVWGEGILQMVDSGNKPFGIVLLLLAEL